MNAHPNPSHPNPARQAVSAGRVLVESLALHGVERVFCVPGESYLEVLDALHGQDRIELIVAKHEAPPPIWPRRTASSRAAPASAW